MAQTDLGFGKGLVGAGSVVAIGYATNELISIIENCARVGVPIPAAVMGWLLNMKSLRLKAASPEQLRELSDE